MADSAIEWTDRVWNPTTGCDRASPGCDSCYALTMARRLKAMGNPKYQRDGNPRTSGPGFGVSVHPDVLTLPLTWRKPTRVFVNSMSDLFHADVGDAFVAEVFAVMAATPHHSYQVLTKRHGRMRSLLSSEEFPYAVADALDRLCETRGEDLPLRLFRRVTLRSRWPLPNVWVGVSVESQQWARTRLSALEGTPAAVRWVSAEPLLEAVDLSPWLPSISWVVCGGESGPGARPFDPEWARSLVAQCRDANVPVFVKQLGSVWAKANGGHSKGGDMSLWPEDLQVREYPSERNAA